MVFFVCLFKFEYLLFRLNKYGGRIDITDATIEETVSQADREYFNGIEKEKQQRQLQVQ